MDLLDYFRRLFDYDRWANREALTSLQAILAPPPRALKVLAHVVAAESLWLDRLRRERQALPVWPEFTLAECAEQLETVTRAWERYLDGLAPGGLGLSIAYTNSKGQSFTDAVRDVLGHVILHSAYHRGQIASQVRASGFAPAYTDYIHCVRQGVIG